VKENIYKGYARVKENKYNSRFVDTYHQYQFNFKYAFQYESIAAGENQLIFQDTIFTWPKNECIRDKKISTMNWIPQI